MQKSLRFYVDILGAKIAIMGTGFYGSVLQNTLFRRSRSTRWRAESIRERSASLRSAMGARTRAIDGWQEMKEVQEDA